MRAFLLFLMVCFLGGPAGSLAQDYEFTLGEEVVDPTASEAPFQLKGADPPTSRTAILGDAQDFSYERRNEPSFDPIEFLPLDPPTGLSERIDRLVYGIKTDVPPEYDSYGYQVRQLMSHIGGDQAYGSLAGIQTQIENIGKAEDLVEVWHETVLSEIALITKQIEADNAPSSLRIRLKLNRAQVDGFFNHMAGWLQRNRALLEFLVTIGKYRFTYENHIIYFSESEDMYAFGKLYLDREKILKVVRDYTPFRMMVY